VKSDRVRNELAAGWLFHYVTGGSVALSYPLLHLAFRASLPEYHFIHALLWGLATTLLPWVILYPAFGWGFFGAKAPKGTRPLLSATVAHLLYGLGLGTVLSIVSQPIVLASIGSR
jgi:hypothetical protein